MMNENIHMLQYVAGALYGISLMMGDGDLKTALASLSEEVSNVVISETIDTEPEQQDTGHVNIYMDDEGDDGR